MKEIAGRFMAVWALLLFAITVVPVCLLILLTGYMKEPRKTEFFRQVCKVWMRLFFLLTLCRLKIKGAEHFKKGENYIVISNHNSFIDVPLLTPFIPGANKTIAKIEISRVPLFGLIYKRGSILVDRKNKDSRRDSYNKMKAVLESGMHMCIYPEGTRNKSNEPLKEFHSGAFRLAIDTGKPIIAAVLFNTKRVLPPNKTMFFRPSKMEMHFLPARYIKAEDTYEELQQEMFILMKNYINLKSKQ
jgi:1-acyl-sn-glycerol-3-phosphate acyltransferase